MSSGVSLRHGKRRSADEQWIRLDDSEQHRRPTVCASLSRRIQRKIVTCYLVSVYSYTCIVPYKNLTNVRKHGYCNFNQKFVKKISSVAIYLILKSVTEESLKMYLELFVMLGISREDVCVCVMPLWMDLCIYVYLRLTLDWLEYILCYYWTPLLRQIQQKQQANNTKTKIGKR